MKEHTPASGGPPRDDLRAARLEEEIGKLARQVAYLQEAIDAMERTSIWRLGEKWYALRYLLARAGRGLSAPFRRGAPPPAAAPRGTKVLFISHDARRMGAPTMLLHFLRWFKEHAGIPFEILLGDGGELMPEFEALAPVTLWQEDLPLDPSVPLAMRMLDRAGRPRRWTLRSRVPSPARTALSIRALERRFRAAGVGLVYSNTITNGRILAALAGLGCPVISHVHELDWCITCRTLPGNNAQVRERTTRYIAASRAVARSLVECLGVREEMIDMVYEFIMPRSPTVRVDQGRIRAELRIPENAWVIGASGTTDWRKGADLFALLARAVCRRLPERPVHFVWVGGDGDTRTMGSLAHDLRHLGLDTCVHFIGARPNPLEYYAVFDVFALMSREDPCPLVMLEAASAGKPVLCFEGSGGAPEFVGEECGYVVPYFDFEEMAVKALALLRSPGLRESMGRAGMKRVRARHEVSVAASRILGVIRRCMGGPGGPR